MDFDLNGNLKPYSPIETTIDEIRKNFVDDFKGSTSRERIFESYLGYINDFKQMIGTDFFQFINGSFVTRKRTPKDLDLVTFLDYETFETLETELMPFKGFVNYPGIDAYIEKVYPASHPFNIRYQSDYLYWTEFFSKNREGQRKGFLKIEFNHAEK